jgi:parallel beta-helix repeat protein
MIVASMAVAPLSATAAPASEWSVRDRPYDSPSRQTTGTPDAATGVVFVVAPWGDDRGAGTHGAPWRTLQRAADRVTAGTTVLIRAGTYAGFVLRRSGTQAAPIKFKGYPGDARPVVDGRGTLANVVKLYQVRHAQFRGLTVRGAYATGHNGAGILIENSSHIQVRGNAIRDNKAFGIKSYNSTFVTVHDNDVSGNAVGIHIGRMNEGTRVTNNRVHHNNKMMVNTVGGYDDAGGEGIALVKSTGRVLVQANRIWSNRAPSYDFGWDGGAFSIYGASNVTITRNRMWDNHNVLETGTDAEMTCTNNAFTRNVAYGTPSGPPVRGIFVRCARNMLIANNTITHLREWALIITTHASGWEGSIVGLRVVNNLFTTYSGKVYGIDSVLPSSVTLDRNLLHNYSGGNIASYAGRHTSSLATLRSWTGREIHGLNTNPRFRDTGSGDYELAGGSPAINRGILVPPTTDGYLGTAPDLGRFEFGR